jgi:2-polyprenyl-3-methyl-5-hydroxy-6-metoxy-1,4-benzoquinol methylase
MSATRLIYRAYRNSKTYFQKNPGFLARVYFFALTLAEKALAQNRKDASNKDKAWRAIYAKLFSHGKPCFYVQTDSPVAYDSIDHVIPRGAANDNTVHRAFNAALYRHFSPSVTISLMDLGCAGGGLVRSIIEDGHVAVGLEGSDYCKVNALGEWKNCPLHLFTCNICEKFQVLYPSGKKALFDVVTAWEVLEHIPEHKVHALIRNISIHLKPGGLFIASVDCTPDFNVFSGAVYHATLQPREWWLSQFRKENIIEKPNHTFSTQEFVRGNGLGLKNWDPNIDNGFHLVLEKSC